MKNKPSSSSSFTETPRPSLTFFFPQISASRASSLRVSASSSSESSESIVIVSSARFLPLRSVSGAGDTGLGSAGCPGRA